MALGSRKDRPPARRALSLPMTQTPMTADPHLEAIGTMVDDRALLERRACQYAAWLAERDGLLRAPARAYNARFDGAATVVLSIYGHGAHEIVVCIPDRVMAFDPNAPAIVLSRGEA